MKEYRRGNQKWTFHRKWQHRVHREEEKQNKDNTICLGHHYMQKKTQIM